MLQFLHWKKLTQVYHFLHYCLHPMLSLLAEMSKTSVVQKKSIAEQEDGTVSFVFSAMFENATV